ncbi:microtubule-associated serine/threonine-protein kinase 3-like [Dendrobates tinctorius]|uniref:microtubule-associated serine/threonine-protein kinase 3-like n=1 Tax=Dendrobates tinctorius TaxID=92724 RepID=UPI003CCA2870
MGIILHEFLLGYVPCDEDSLRKLYNDFVIDDIVWDCDDAPPQDAQNLITELLRTHPVHRLGTDNSDIRNHLDDEEDTSVDNESLDFLNFISSSERHAKVSV